MKELPDPSPKTESIPITTFAKEEGREVLLAHIENAFELYKTMGLAPESFQYFEEEQKLEIQFTPSENQEGNAGITHGGVMAFMIDASAGALAMAVIDKENVALTENTNTNNIRTARTGIPTRVVSSLSEPEEEVNKRAVHVHTEIYQEDVMVAQADTTLKTVAKRTLERLHTNNENNT